MKNVFVVVSKYVTQSICLSELYLSRGSSSLLQQVILRLAAQQLTGSNVRFRPGDQSPSHSLTQTLEGRRRSVRSLNLESSDFMSLISFLRCLFFSDSSKSCFSSDTSCFLFSSFLFIGMIVIERAYTGTYGREEGRVCTGPLIEL